jgi:hypothetical protein
LQAAETSAREARNATEIHGAARPSIEGAKEELLPARGAFESSEMDSEVVLGAGSLDVFAVSVGG